MLFYFYIRNRGIILKHKTLYYGLLTWYPLVSSVIMLLVWELGSVIGMPFCGMFFFRLTELTVLYFTNFSGTLIWIMLIGYLLCHLVLIVFPILFCRKKKPLFCWIPATLFLADTALIVFAMIDVGIESYYLINLSEHLIYGVLLLWVSFTSGKKRI